MVCCESDVTCRAIGRSCEMEVETLEERHAREKKELRNKVSEMLKSARDKKAKKDVRVQIQLLEDELFQRHQQEAAATIDTNDDEAVAPEACEGQLHPHQEEEEESTFKPSKAQRKKAAKEAKAKQRRAEAEEEAKGMVDHKAIENEALAAKLRKLNLRVVEIPADGHCLYRSISRQLDILEGVVITVEELRKLCAKYILDHRDDFTAFLIGEEDDNIDDVDTYVSKIVRVDPVHWGGEPELVALAGALNRDIVVHSADSALWKAEAASRGRSENPLQVSYHRYYFGLGNHYNSVESA
eukprot:TRINITY_DN7339_c0_g1_i1.p1 TRINITY_DN7339_c0_g1~~TRINITY_DN7339_c0_g1_i1.p1  ORF type:complete len:298 (-),score=81.45 TRINITY_DN7339_c0_g1_i1:8-901(-)